jgi:hypothetical protein
MKGSAITGPVAKECVCTHISLCHLTMLICNNLGGLMATNCVERRHSGLGLCIPSAPLLLPNQVVISCTKMPIHLHAYMNIALCIALQDHEGIIILQFSSVAQLVTLAFISPCESSCPRKSIMVIEHRQKVHRRSFKYIVRCQHE